jgi:deoxynucleoside triphosphate triphosphohydrolase SAMHD1
MSFSRVIDDEICYHMKEVYNVYEMFHTRYGLFKQVYLHRVGTFACLLVYIYPSKLVNTHV